MNWNKKEGLLSIYYHGATILLNLPNALQSQADLPLLDVGET